MIISIGKKLIVRNKDTSTTNSIITTNTSKNINLLPKINLSIAPSYIIYGR